jgi:hypothetical protein
MSLSFFYRHIRDIMVFLPKEIFLQILDFADIDTRIKFKHIKKMKIEILDNLHYKAPVLWNNDILEYTFFLPIHRKKQYVLIINYQCGFLHMEFVLVDFNYSQDELLYSIEYNDTLIYK